MSDSKNDNKPEVETEDDAKNKIAMQTIYFETAEKVDLVTVNQEVDYLDLSQTKLTIIEDFSRFHNLNHICYRNNLLKSLASENLRASKGLSKIRELDFYDNQIEKIENLDELTTLETLDLSFNRLKKIENLSALCNLRKLYLVHNSITKIENLDELKKLEMLELGDNQLRTIENLDELQQLQQLYLGKNKLRKLENLHLPNLTILSIQSNRLTKLENLDSLVSLRELYMSDNGLKKIEGLEKTTQLVVLDLSNNQIERIENISHLKKLEEFWFNNNQLSNWEDVDTLRDLPSLKCLYLEHNPIYYLNNKRPSVTSGLVNNVESNNPAYRRKILFTLTNLEQLDATLCTRTQNV